jgi:hypothetical protein
MSIKKKVFAVAATMTMVGGVSAVGLMSAGATTASCATGCVTGYGQEFSLGTPEYPLPGSQGFVFDVLRQGEKAGQPVILFRDSDSDPAEDFTLSDEGLVSGFFTAGLVSAAVDLHYGGGCETYTTTGSPPVVTCTTYYPNDTAYELEYSPYGVDSGLCVGTGSTAGNGTPVVLEPCGLSSKTVWVQDSGTVLDSYYPLINGSGTSFTDPYVLHYPANAYPTDMPRPQLNTYALQQYSTGKVFDNEEWYLTTSSS